VRALLVAALLTAGCGTAPVEGHGLAVDPPRGWHVRIAQPPRTALSLAGATVAIGTNGIFDARFQRALRPDDVALALIDYTPPPRGRTRRWNASFPIRRPRLRLRDVRTFEGQYARGGANTSFRFRGRYFQLVAFFGERPTPRDLARANAFLAQVRVSPR
jgi:hypothetical protein